VMPLVSLQARKLGGSVQTKLQDKLPDVLCDRTMVEQVLLNLARNAMQAMDEAHIEHPELVLQVRATPATEAGKRWLEFSVADCGPGIPEVVKQQLFTPFFTTKAEGMGLGLSIAHSLVLAHGGEIHAENNAEGGATFRFTIPADVVPAAS